VRHWVLHFNTGAVTWEYRAFGSLTLFFVGVFDVCLSSRVEVDAERITLSLNPIGAGLFSALPLRQSKRRNLRRVFARADCESCLRVRSGLTSRAS